MNILSTEVEHAPPADPPDTATARGIYRPPIKIEQMAHAKGLPLPKYGTEYSAAFDLPAAKEVTIESGQQGMVETGLRFEIEIGYCGQISMRSGSARKLNLIIMNAPGIVDSDFRGEVMICLFNLGITHCVIKRGQCVAQMIITAVRRPIPTLADFISRTVRGEGGFGSTG